MYKELRSLYQKVTGLSVLRFDHAKTIYIGIGVRAGDSTKNGE